MPHGTCAATANAATTLQVSGTNGTAVFSLQARADISAVTSSGALPRAAHVRAPSVAATPSGGVAVAYSVIAPSIAPSMYVSTQQAQGPLTVPQVRQAWGTVRKSEPGSAAAHASAPFRKGAEGGGRGR